MLLCVRIRLYMCPHTTIYASSYYYICVRILLYMCPHTIYVSNLSAGKPWRRCSQDDPYACIPYHCAANQEGTTECKILQNNPIQALVDMDVRCVLTTAYFLMCVADIILYVSSHALYHMLLYVCSMPHTLDTRPHSTKTLVDMDVRCWDKGRSMWQFEMTRDGCKDYLPWRGIYLSLSPLFSLSLSRSLSPTPPHTAHVGVETRK